MLASASRSARSTTPSTASAGCPQEKLIEYGIPITRWGGNPSTRYNWKLGVDSAGNDWFFKNRGKLISKLTTPAT